MSTSLTNLQNNVEDLYSLLRFLRIKPLHQWDRFNEQIRKPMMAGRTGTPMKRLHVSLVLQGYQSIYLLCPPSLS
jgi:SNF2 family DNA or RNA helicase